MLQFNTAGESHGQALLAWISGLPAVLRVDLDFVNGELHRRQLGYGRGGRQKIEKDKVDFIFGEMSSASALAIMQVVQKFKKLYFNTGANSDELRQAKCNRYTFHTESSNSQMILSTGRYLVKNKKVNRWYFVTPDYTYGYDCYNLASGILKKEGGANLGQDLVP